jgi:hypothetical protein
MNRRAAAAGIVAAALAATAAAGQLAERPLEGALAHPAIAYFTAPTSDVVSALGRRLEDGTARLEFDERTGYLPSVVDALHVAVDSQMLVMSKTGVQALYTEPSNPRAIFFNDAVAVGYIRGAPLLELAVHDPRQGVLFYTLEQKRQARPAFDRPRGCVRCHQAYSTLHVPGLLARSTAIAADGLPLSQFGGYDADDRTPFRRRWGGWYVTGTHGDMRHMGNALVASGSNPEQAISDRTLNKTSLDGLFDAAGYLSAHSDIAALMVFQHQSHMTNLITRVGWEARIAAASGSDAARRALGDAVIELVDYLLFVDEEPLTATVTGTTTFANRFSADGPADRRGRSLRQLDLRHRLLKYPCSFMVYSAAFQALPAEARLAIYRRALDILEGRDRAAQYARLSPSDARAIVEILRDTIEDFPPEAPQ